MFSYSLQSKITLTFEIVICKMRTRKQKMIYFSHSNSLADEDYDSMHHREDHETAMWAHRHHTLQRRKQLLKLETGRTTNGGAVERRRRRPPKNNNHNNGGEKGRLSREPNNPLQQM